MTLVVETGAGVRGANSYVTVEYVTNYLTARGRASENDWVNLPVAAQEAALISATDYLDTRFGLKFKGRPSLEFMEVKAKGLIVFSAQPQDGDSFQLGDEEWTFLSAVVEQPYVVLIGNTAETTAQNLTAAINGAAGAGTTYSKGTPPSRHATASEGSGVVMLTASAAGSGGNSTILTGSVTNATLTSFSGGVDGGIQPLAWPRSNAYDQNGSLIKGIPDSLKRSVSEYAVRASDSALLPDPVSDSGGDVIKRREKVGPIEEEVEYSAGSTGSQTFKPYPSADRLLTPLLLGSSGGGVIRA